MSPCPFGGVNLHLTFPGWGAQARLEPAELQPTKMNYFLGSDAARWRSNVPTYASLVWHDIAPGVDLAFGNTWRIVTTLHSPPPHRRR